MKSCVCGHPETVHDLLTMAVPLAPREALYQVPTQMGSIAKTYPNSPLERSECWCGCGEYLVDEDRDAAS